MNRLRLLPALALTAGLLVSAGAFAQPPGASGQPVPGGRGPGPDTSLPILPKSAGAFVTLKVSALADHPDLKPVLAELAKQPDALAGITEITGVSPMDIDRVTLFWPRLDGGHADPILVVTTRTAFNEARVLKALKAEPVFGGDFRGGGGRWKASGRGNAAPKSSVKVAEPSAPDPKEPFEQPQPQLLLPLEPVKPQPDDLCAASADAGPGDPLFYGLERGPFQALFLIDEHTLVFLPSVEGGDITTMAMLAMLLKKSASGPLADAITAAGKHTFAAGVNLSPLFREFDHFTPKDLVPYTALFTARTAVLTGDLDKAAKFTLTLNFDDIAAAKRAAPVLEEGIATITEKIDDLAKEFKESNRPFEKSVAPLLAAFVAGLKKSTVKADGNAVVAITEIDVGPVAAKALGELLQAVQSRKKAALRMNNLKQIGLALHNYHDVYGKFPTNVYGPKGEALLSWRVHLLPYLEEDNLYRQFKMDEPWDGPTNKALIEKMPKSFMAPDRAHAKGKTYYQAFVGPAPGKPLPKGIYGRPWLLEGDKNGIRFTDIHDGTSNTIAVIEAGEGVFWSKPDDLPFGGAVPLLGEKGWDRTPALRFDGSVLLFPTNLRPEEFWPHITINGGEVTPDLEDNRGFGRSRPTPAVGVGQEPLPSNPAPAKPDGAGPLRDLEERVAELTLLLQDDQARAAIAEATLEKATKAFQAGVVTAEEVEKAKVLATEARVRVAARMAELTVLKGKLDNAKKGSSPRK
jgi:hypothetical protein